MDARFDLFPLGSLDSSVITTVWIGVWAVAFLNLRLGWSFSGLVVPGYLVPLLLVKPWSAVTICAEGVVTYLVVRWLSERGPFRTWSNLFGRDRYFAFLLVSVPVRLVFDAWLLPLAGGLLNAHLGFEFDYHNNLPGFGLIIIPLVANQFWKTGLLHALLPIGVPVAFTYVVTRYVLMEWTNFSLANLQYVYGELAADLLASPKTYIVVLTTAYLASVMNQRYAWEYHGILLPALLAAEWYEPWKVLVTFVEAAFIFGLASLVLKAPGVRKMSFEGASKALFFFNVGFAYKMLLGHLLVRFAVGEKATDYFAFGYMISTLMALKAHDKGIPLRLTRAVLQVSLTGALLGSLIGYGLTFLPRWGPTGPVEMSPAADAPPGRLFDALHGDRPGLYGPTPPPVPDAAQRATFTRALGELLAAGSAPVTGRVETARRLLGEVGYELHELRGGVLYLRERPPGRGWGLYALDLAHRGGPAIEVPAPLDEWAALDAGAVLFERWQGRALAVAGGRRTGRFARPADDARSFFHAFTTAVGGQDVLRLRGHADAEPEPATVVRVSTALPAGLRLADLRAVTGPFDLEWAATGRPAESFVELTLNRTARRALLARSAVGDDRPSAGLAQAEGNLREWLLARRAEIADAGTNLYKPATVGELLYLDDAVLTPIARAVRSRGDRPAWSPTELDALRAAAAAAGAFRYTLTAFRDTATETDYLVLAEAGGLPRRCWGTYVFRVGGASPFVVQVPRPLAEQNSYEFGVALFDRTSAAVLAVVGAHPDANRDHSADLTRQKSRVSLFHLVAQVALREAGDDPSMLVTCRALGVSPVGLTPDADVVLATDNGATGEAALTPLGADLYRVLARDRLAVRFADGSADTSGYGAIGAARTSYLPQTTNKELAIVWVAPLARSNFRQQVENDLQRAHFAALDVATVQRRLDDHLAPVAARPGPARVTENVRAALVRYAATQDVVALHAAVTAGRAAGLRFERVLDPDTQRAFLVLDDGAGVPLVANVGTRSAPEGDAPRAARLDRAAVADYVRSGRFWLEIGGGP